MCKNTPEESFKKYYNACKTYYNKTKDKKKNTNKKFLWVEDCKSFNDSESEVEYLFILESPHTNEVENGYPLAGDSGVEISQYLLGTDTPFGELVNDSKNNNTTTILGNKKIAIINVSNVPLQKVENVSNVPLQKVETILSNSKYIIGIEDYLKKIRINGKKDEYLKKDFCERLDKYLNNNHKLKQIILCGVCAQKYFNRYSKDIPNLKNKTLCVPHPARKQWSSNPRKNLKYKNNLNSLKMSFK